MSSAFPDRASPLNISSAAGPAIMQIASRSIVSFVSGRGHRAMDTLAEKIERYAAVEAVELVLSIELVPISL